MSEPVVEYAYCPECKKRLLDKGEINFGTMTHKKCGSVIAGSFLVGGTPDYLESEATDWIVSPVKDGNYIIDDRLKNSICSILVTYETARRRKYVKQVQCDYGRVSKKVGGKIIAWMPIPKPFGK